MLARLRRMRCPGLDCKVQTFRQQVPGALERATSGAPSGWPSRLARRPRISRAAPRSATAVVIGCSRHAALRVLVCIPLPEVLVPRVIGTDDFALRRGLAYPTIIIDAVTGRRVDVLPGHTGDVVGEWLRAHPGVEVVCRDGSGAYGEAVGKALHGAVQAGDAGICGTASPKPRGRKVAAHSACRPSRAHGFESIGGPGPRDRVGTGLAAVTSYPVALPGDQAGGRPGNVC